jgi:FdhD protein
MDDDPKHPARVKFVPAARITTAASPEPTRQETVCVIEETAVTIDVESVESYTLLCTPSDNRALAAGFMLTEGVIDSMADISILKECDDDPNTVRVRLTGGTPRIDDPGRNLLIVSSCGACGMESLKERISALPRALSTLQIDACLLYSVYEQLRKQQRLFEACGGTHAAALFGRDGSIIAAAEDTGRHNALDKAIGKCLLADIETKGLGAALTSRLSLEMVSKCARAGIELITAVSAPTSMAIDVAQACNITLCAFVRETRATVFTYPERLIGQDHAPDTD